VRDRIAHLRALKLRAAGDAAGAEAVLLDIVARDPGDGDAYRMLSDIAFVRGDGAAGLALQRSALERQRLYSRIAPDERRRVVVLCAPGDFTANAPLELVTDPVTTTLHQYYCVEGADAAEIPAADVAVVAMGESPWVVPHLRIANRLLRRTGLPAINRPSRILGSNRAKLARTVAGMRDLTMAPVVDTPRAVLAAATEGFPLAVRPLGSQAGERFERLEDAAQRDAYLDANADAAFFVSPFVPYANADGYYRKYRYAIVDGEPYPYHLGISTRWKVHYYSTVDDHRLWMREEEARFLTDGDGGRTDGLTDALRGLAARMGLEYFCADCTIGPDGRPLLFEADAAMLVHGIDPTGEFAYKRPQQQRIFAAFEAMLDRRITS